MRVNINNKSIYTAEDLVGLVSNNSDPGVPPYRRGPYKTMYCERPWTIRQYTGFGTSEETNVAFKKSLAEGGQGLSVAFDLPTHLGFDSDDPAAMADVGRTGVAIDSVEDMKRLFKGIDLSRVSVSMTMNGAILPVLAAFIVAAQEQGVAPATLRGTIQNDILKEFMVRNTWIHDPEASMRITTDVVAWLARNAPSFNSMSISGYHFKEGGAEAPLELALTMANAREYLNHLHEAGLELESFCPRLSFFFGVGLDFFNEIAKLRAARVLWSEIITELGGSAQSARMRMHCQTSGWSLTSKEPHNNLIRTSIEAMAAVFGGTQSLHTNGYDEAHSIPTEHSARLARNTQLILQKETGICDVVDPWGGSYMMESLTDEMINKVRIWMQRIEEQGGVISAIKSGWVQREIHQHSLVAQADIDSGRKPIVGVNCYRLDSPDKGHPMVRAINSDEVVADQSKRLKHLKATRDPSVVAQTLATLRKVANGEEEKNVLEATIDAIRARATVGECVKALVSGWPRYQAPSQYSPSHYQSKRKMETEWHKVKKEVLTLTEKLNRKPKILLAKLGLDGHDRGIRVLAAGLTDLGFSITLLPLLTSPTYVAKYAAKTHYDIVGISLLSGAHIQLLTELLKQMRGHVTAKTPVIVGGVIPESDCHTLKKLGVAVVFLQGEPIEKVAKVLTELIRTEKNPLEVSIR